MNMRTLFSALVLTALCVAPALAQRTGVTITQFANLPATCTPQQPFVVTDANATCTAGSGAARWCLCTDAGNAYEPDPGGTPDPDSVGTSQLNDGSDTPLVGQIVAVDSAASTDFEYLALGLGLANDGDTLGPDHSQTLAGNPALNVDECIPVATAAGGGSLCEGSSADTNEMLFLIPDLNESDTTHRFVTDIAAQTLTNKTLTTPTIGSFTNSAHDHADAAGGGDVALATGSTATTAASGDTDTSVATTAFVDDAIRGWWNWNAFDMMPDGQFCKGPVGVTINSGPIVGSIDCDDSATSVLYGDVLLELYEGGTLIFTVEAINVNATPSGALDFDFSAQCRGDSDVVNATWGSAVQATMTFATQYDVMHGDTVGAVTPDGTCAAGDTLYWRAVMDDTATTTEVADVSITGISLREQ